MSEEALKKALEAPEGEAKEPANDAKQDDPPETDGIAQEAEQEIEFSEDAWKASQEEQARSDGWKPLSEFVKGGGDPKQWVSAEMFNVRGEFIGKLKAKDRDVDRIVQERVAGVKKLYDARLTELQQNRDKAIEDGDVKQVKNIEKQMADLQTPVAPQVDDRVKEWNETNQWIFEVSPKSSYAKEIFARHTSQGMSPADALDVVDREIKKAFPDNPEQKPKGHVPGSEKGSGAKPFKAKAKTLSMSDLLPEEKNLWKNMSDAWGNDESKFLKAVADARAAEEK